LLKVPLKHQKSNKKFINSSFKFYWRKIRWCLLALWDKKEFIYIIINVRITIGNFERLIA
jgi:hypothetical protein